MHIIYYFPILILFRIQFVHRNIFKERNHREYLAYVRARHVRTTYVLSKVVRSWREYSATVTQSIRVVEERVQKRTEMKIMQGQMRQFVGGFSILDAR